MLKNKSLMIKIFLLLAIFESGLTIYTLGSIPADSKNAMFFGFSISRLFLLAGIALLFGIAAFLLVRFFLSPAFGNNTIKRLDVFLGGEKRYILFDVLAWLITTLGVLFLLLPDTMLGEALYQRVLPVVVLGIMLALQTLMFKFLWGNKREINLDSWMKWKGTWAPTGVTFGVFILLWIFIGLTGIGIVPEKAGWYPPGTPVLPQQVLIAWGAGFLFFTIGMMSWFKKNLEKLDYILVVILCLIAGFIWLMEPMERLSYFTTDPTPPNFESYPYSDAALYDTFAQNYLIGTSLDVGLTHRPLYSIFLAFLHALFGQNFNSVIAAQAIILSAFPAGLYLLASRIGGRPAAILAALIVIFREQNAIALTNVIEVSHSKLLMSDLPTMALIIWFVYFWVTWEQDRDNKAYLGVIAGAFLGFAILVRSQSQLMIPVILLYIVFISQGERKSNIKKALVFLFGVLVVAAPWIWRNYQVSGRAVVEYHDFYTRVIASGYTDSPDAIEQIPGETVDEYNSRMFSLIASYIRENPLEVARFYTSYFLHNEISSVVYLPMALKFSDARTYVREIGVWDTKDPFGSLPAEILPLFLIKLFMVALGVGAAYQRAKWVGLAPLLLHFSYSLSVVPFRTSGWRFILPVDWVSSLYFSIGLMHLSIMVFLMFSKRGGQAMYEPLSIIRTLEGSISWKGIFQAISVFFIIGLSFPLVEKMIPQRYPSMDSPSLIQRYELDEIRLDNGSMLQTKDLELFLEQEPSAVILYGRSLYPSFYESGEFWGDDDTYSLDIRSISRLQFLLIGPVREIVFLPVLESPSFFPNASDVLVIGCREDAGIRALAVRVDSQTIFTGSSPWNGLICPDQ